MPLKHEWRRQGDKLPDRNGQRLREVGGWRDGILSGFGISVLTTERFCQNDREDRSLYDTMVAIRDRLNWDLQIQHPVTPGDYITSGPDDARARCFRDKLTEAIDTLQPLFEAACTRERRESVGKLSCAGRS